MPRNSIEAAFLYQAELMNRDSRLRSGMAVMLFLVVH
jgi:tetrahydromethanopterin S-methyltransferase subunit F